VIVGQLSSLSLAGYLSYNRNSYLCLVIGATMNVQTIIPHSAEAAVGKYCHLYQAISYYKAINN
jgi:hypothetical protein